MLPNGIQKAPYLSMLKYTAGGKELDNELEMDSDPSSIQLLGACPKEIDGMAPQTQVHRGSHSTEETLPEYLRVPGTVGARSLPSGS